MDTHKNRVYGIGVAITAVLAAFVYPASFRSGSLLGALLITAGLMAALFVVTARAGGPPRRAAAMGWGAVLAVLVVLPGTVLAVTGAPDAPGFWGRLGAVADQGVDFVRRRGDPPVHRTPFWMWVGFLAHWILPFVACVGFMRWLADEEHGPPRHVRERRRRRDRAGTASPPQGRGFTADDLHRAVSQDDAATARAALAAGVAPDTRDPSDEPLVFIAARHDAEDLVEAFLEAGIDRGVRGPGGQTLLHAVARWDRAASLIPRLLDEGLPVDVRDDVGETPFLTATRALCQPAMTRLLDAGADPRVRTSAGDTAMHVLLRGTRPSDDEATVQRRVRWLRRFLGEGMDPAASGQYGEAALDLAVSQHVAAYLNVLLAHRSSAGEEERGTARRRAADAMASALLRALVEGRAEAVARLLEAGAPVDVWAAILLGDRGGVEAAVAADRGLLAAVHPERRAGAVGFAIHAGHFDLAEWLLRTGADAGAPGMRDTVLVDAIRAGAPLSLVEAIVLGLPPGRIEWGDGDGRSPLHWAAREGRADVVDLLLEAGARADARTERGGTVLDATDDPDIRARLVAAGAPPR